jgi:hypothetical protein
MLLVGNPEAPAAAEDTAQWHYRLNRKVQARPERVSGWRATQIPLHYYLARDAESILAASRHGHLSAL